VVFHTLPADDQQPRVLALRRRMLSDRLLRQWIVEEVGTHRAL